MCGWCDEQMTGQSSISHCTSPSCSGTRRYCWPGDGAGGPGGARAGDAGCAGDAAGRRLALPACSCISMHILSCWPACLALIEQLSGTIPPLPLTCAWPAGPGRRPHAAVHHAARRERAPGQHAGAARQRACGAGAGGGGQGGPAGAAEGGGCQAGWCANRAFSNGGARDLACVRGAPRSAALPRSDCNRTSLPPCPLQRSSRRRRPRWPPAARSWRRRARSWSARGPSWPRRPRPCRTRTTSSWSCRRALD